MASRRILELVFTLFLVAVVLSRSMAQSDCNNVVASLSPCLDYITGNSSNPSSDCCNQLSNVIKEQALCLCQIISGTAPSIGVKVNQTQALALPGACHLQTPSISQCNVTATPPSGAPNRPSGGSPGTPPGGEASHGYRIKMSFVDDGLFFIPVITASFVSISTVFL